jgi:hypothetical protein
MDETPSVPSPPLSARGRDQVHLLEEDLAERWRVSVRTIQRWRSQGTVPRHFRVNQRVLYRLSDVEAFEIGLIHFGNEH